MTLTLDQLTFQLCQLETALELRIGDLPAAQIIREATRRLELQRRALAYYRDEYTGYEPSVSVFDRMVDELIGPSDSASEVQK